MPRVGVLHAVPDDPRLVGTWLYGERPARFHISRTRGSGFRFQERISQGQIVSGILRPRGPWLHATVTFKDGAAMGAIRLRLVEERDGEALLCSVKAPGSVSWSPDTLARKKVHYAMLALEDDHLPRSPAPAPRGGASSPGRPGLGWGVLLPGASWWDVGRACCAAPSYRLQLECAFVSEPAGGGEPERRQQPVGELRVALGIEPVLACTEYRHPVSPPQLGLGSTVWLDHTFLLLEVGVGGTWGLCIEKLSDKLEVMAGCREVVKVYAARHRATGQGRPIGHDLPIDERPRRELESRILISDLFDWIEGPLAMSWKPYHPLDANGEHFARELLAYLTRKDEPTPDCQLQPVQGHTHER